MFSFFIKTTKQYFEINYRKFNLLFKLENLKNKNKNILMTNNIESEIKIISSFYNTSDISNLNK